MANFPSSSTPAVAVLVVILLAWTSLAKVEAQPTFKCSTNGSTSCRSFIDYVSPKATHLRDIQNLFQVKNHRNILGVNGLPTSTSPDAAVSAEQVVRIPFKCKCDSKSNGTGLSDGRPKYKVQSGDTLYHIAAEVFSNLVTFRQIQAVNGIKDADLIEIGQELWIPLPCSCDQVNGVQVLHYGHVVRPGSSVEQMAETYGVTADTILSLNGIKNASNLLAGQVLDIPLKVCSSNVRNDSLDFPLLVANGTYVYTANNCVRCKCDAANNWTLQCVPSQLKPSSNSWSACPTMQCEGSGNLFLGNTTSSDSCNSTTCGYAGYNSRNILTFVTANSTCPASGVPSTGTGTGAAATSALRHSGWTCLLILTHIILLYAYLP